MVRITIQIFNDVVTSGALKGSPVRILETSLIHITSLLFRYFLIASNYFFYGESMVGYFGILVNKINVLTFLVRYHRFISFSM